MLLAIDIGNTSISFGLFKGRRLLRRGVIAARHKHGYTRFKTLFKKYKIEDAIICSVVPSIDKPLGKEIARHLGKPPIYIGKQFKVPIKNLYRKPAQVGQDRLVNAYAAVTLFGAPSIIVDFGTAVTFDAVSKNKEYLGGMIFPGLEMSIEGLYEKTALLPKVRLAAPSGLIGTDTKNSILSGIVYGFAALTEDLTKRINSKIGGSARIIGTGGNIGIVKRYCRVFHNTDKDLTLKGLNLLYERMGTGLFSFYKTRSCE